MVIPYPEELIYKDMLLQKDYRLNCSPRNADGSYAYDQPFGEYLAWLDEYLYHCDLVLTEEQRRIECFIGCGGLSGLSLGIHAAQYESLSSSRPEYEFPDDFESSLDMEGLQPIVSEDPFREYLEWLDEVDIDDYRPTKREFVAEDYGWFLEKRREEQDFRTCWPDFVKLSPIVWMFKVDVKNSELPDFGWRVHLSLILKKIPEKSKRLVELESFWDEYIDMINK